MSKEILNEETGEMEIVYTQAELDAMKSEHEKTLAEKDEHVKQKLEEFKTGKTAQELKDIEREKAIEEAKKIAEEARVKIDSVEKQRVDSIKNTYADMYSGGDPSTKQKLEDAFKVIEAGRKANGFEIKTDADYGVLMKEAAQFAGITAAPSPVFPMFGGSNPSFTKDKGQVSEEENKTFLEAVGYEHPKPKE